MQRKRGLELGRPFGFPLIVHLSWLPAGALMVAHLSFSRFGGDTLTVSVALSLAATAAFFGSVIVHELGHEAARRLMRVPTADIRLFMFGGTARTRAEPRSSGAHIAIALAGPLTTGSLGVGCLFAAWALPGRLGEFVWTVAVANLALAGINLLPALPLDGGRLMEGLRWARRGDRHGGVRTAAKTGQVLGAGSVMGGGWLAATSTLTPDVAAGLWLVITGIFLYTEARRLARADAVVATLQDGTAGGWARPFAARVRAEAPVPGDGGPYAVSDGGRLAGILTSKRLGTARGSRAGEAMIPWTPSIALPADEPLPSALTRLAASADGALVVVDQNGVVRGLLDHDGVRERLGEK